MIYEIVTPSVTITIESQDELAAIVTCLIVGQGKYSLNNEEGETVCPLFLDGGSDECIEFIENKFVSFLEYMKDKNNRKAVKLCLESAACLSFSEREIYNKSLRQLIQSLIMPGTVPQIRND